MLLASCVNTPIDHNVLHYLCIPVVRCSVSCVNWAQAKGPVHTRRKGDENGASEKLNLLLLNGGVFTQASKSNGSEITLRKSASASFMSEVRNSFPDNMRETARISLHGSPAKNWGEGGLFVTETLWNTVKLMFLVRGTMKRRRRRHGATHRRRVLTSPFFESVTVCGLQMVSLAQAASGHSHVEIVWLGGVRWPRNREVRWGLFGRRNSFLPLFRVRVPGLISGGSPHPPSPCARNKTSGEQTCAFTFLSVKPKWTAALVTQELFAECDNCDSYEWFHNPCEDRFVFIWSGLKRFAPQDLSVPKRPFCPWQKAICIFQLQLDNFTHNRKPSLPFHCSQSLPTWFSFFPPSQMQCPLAIENTRMPQIFFLSHAHNSKFFLSNFLQIKLGFKLWRQKNNVWGFWIVPVRNTRETELCEFPMQGTKICKSQI